MPAAPSMFSFFAVAFYGVVALSAMCALANAISHRQISWHVATWGMIAVLFLTLAMMRMFAFEDLLREELRLALRVEGTYDDRRALQGPLFAALFVVAAVITGVWFYHVSRTIHGRRNIATMIAAGCALGMIFLVLVRIVSLHSVDYLLYGPFKLNWIIDLGASVAVMACGVYYWRVVSGKA